MLQKIKNYHKETAFIINYIVIQFTIWFIRFVYPSVYYIFYKFGNKETADKEESNMYSLVEGILVVLLHVIFIFGGGYICDLFDVEGYYSILDSVVVLYIIVCTDIFSITKILVTILKINYKDGNVDLITKTGKMIFKIIYENKDLDKIESKVLNMYNNYLKLSYTILKETKGNVKVGTFLNVEVHETNLMLLNLIVAYYRIDKFKNMKKLIDTFDDMANNKDGYYNFDIQLLSIDDNKLASWCKRQVEAIIVSKARKNVKWVMNVNVTIDIGEFFELYLEAILENYQQKYLDATTYKSKANNLFDCFYETRCAGRKLHTDKIYQPEIFTLTDIMKNIHNVLNQQESRSILENAIWGED